MKDLNHIVHKYQMHLIDQCQLHAISAPETMETFRYISFSGYTSVVMVLMAEGTN